MTKLSRANIAYMTGIALIAVTVNPFLKSVGLLPADVLRSYGINYPGTPQIFWGPFMAFLLLVCYAKTGEPLIFPVIGTLRAFALGFIFPANMAHLGTGLAGILAGIIAARLVRNVRKVDLATWAPLLGGIYAVSHAAGNYLTTLLLGPAAQTRMIILSPHWAIGVLAGSLALGVLAGFGADKLMGLLPQKAVDLASKSPSVA